MYIALISAIFLSPDAWAISCERYRKYINDRNVVPAENEWDAAWCEQLPKTCGESWLFFNPKGMQTLYFKSACFFSLALKHADDRYCSKVVERKSFLQDGSYFTPENCRRKVNTKKLLQSAKSPPPNAIHRLLTLQFDASIPASIAVGLSGGLPGIYGIRLTADLIPLHASTPKQIALMNLDKQQISYTENYAHLGVGRVAWLELTAEEKKINLNIEEPSIKSVRQMLLQKGSVEFNLELIFLEGPDGWAAKPETLNSLTTQVQLRMPR